MFVSWLYSVLSMILAVLVAIVCGVTYSIDPAYVNNIYMATVSCVTVFLLIVFCADFQSVTFGGFFMCYLGKYILWAVAEFWQNIGIVLFYPVLVVCTPLLIILVKMRVVFPSDYFIKTQKSMVAMGESAWEATPQLVLQLYIVFLTIDRDIKWIQIMAIASSAFTLPIPAIELYLEGKNQEATIKTILMYFPLFFLANVFRIASVSIFLAILSLPWTLLLVLLSGTLYLILSGFILGSWFDYGSFEASFQSPLKLTNLGLGESMDSGPDDALKETVNPFHRRFSFIWYMVLYSLTLIIIWTIFYFDKNVSIFNLIKLENNDNILLATFKDGLYMDIFIGSTLGIGVAAFIMDYVYSCFNCGVFVFK